MVWSILSILRPSTDKNAPSFLPGRIVLYLGFDMVFAFSETLRKFMSQYASDYNKYMQGPPGTAAPIGLGFRV